MSVTASFSNVEFYKMQGLGNDFLVTDDQRCQVSLTPELISQWADRHYGIGFDQLLYLSQSSEPGVDLIYEIYNADGSKVSQCGNGARCAARYALALGLSKKNIMVLKTATTTMTAEVLKNDLVEVSMGQPDFSAKALPFLPNWPTDERGFFKPDDVASGLAFDVVSMGNPHIVIPVAELDKVDVEKVGSYLSNHKYFPERTNVGFAEIVSQERVKLVVYERGAGITRACGSGACAAAAILRKLGVVKDRLHVNMTDGELEISWKGPQSEEPLLMKGPAEFVYQGKI